MQLNETTSDETPAADKAVPVPDWLAVKRSRQSKLAESSPVSIAVAEPPVPPALSVIVQADPRKPSVVPPAVLAKELIPKKVLDRRHWFVRMLSRDEAIGMLISLAIHTVVLLTLGLVIMSNVSKQETINLWGLLGESEQAGTDMVIDTALPGDAGESAIQEMTNIAQPLESLSSGSDIPEMVRVGLSGSGGGKGAGDGEGGSGISLGVAGPKIPGHAQTKGSFTAWADPRDPKPGQKYDIVIQVRLPSSVKKFRAADLTGRVIGTDGYKQPIHFEPTVQLDVEEGAVEIRITVPGAAQKVRDTIRVESKLLREKQTFEIEF